MPAKRCNVDIKPLSLVTSEREQIHRLALASALLAKGQARRLAAQQVGIEAPAPQLKIANPLDFGHNGPITSGISQSHGINLSK